MPVLLKALTQRSAPACRTHKGLFLRAPLFKLMSVISTYSPKLQPYKAVTFYKRWKGFCWERGGLRAHFDSGQTGSQQRLLFERQPAHCVREPGVLQAEKSLQNCFELTIPKERPSVPRKIRGMQKSCQSATNSEIVIKTRQIKPSRVVGLL